MDTYTITKNGVTFEIDRQTSKYGENRVAAHLDGKTAIGQLPGIPTRAYPRIEFTFNTDQWLHERADFRGWVVDDYETDEDLRQRPTDTCTFDLTNEEAAALTAWRTPYAPQAVPVPSAQPVPEPQAVDFDSGLGIGGLSRYEEPPAIPSVAALERYERMLEQATTCTRCGASSLDGAMFTTLAGGDVCDDCVG
jgi:hypothetical protein